MGAHRGRVNEMHFPVHITFVFQGRLQLGEHLVPCARFAPALKATVDGSPFAIAFGQVTPWSARPQDPQNTVQDLAMVLCGSSPFRFRLWQQ